MIDEDGGRYDDFYIRAYLPTEGILDFTSTVYTYYGLRHERAPEDVTKVIFHPSVTNIHGHAFWGCRSLVRITIPDTITRIEGYAFYDCVSLIFIRLSPNLESIWMQAFYKCKSIEAVFLPPTVNRIDNAAFRDCKSLRFCILPETIDHVCNNVFQGFLIDCQPQSATSCSKYATVLPSLLNQFKNAFIHTEANALQRLTINKWWHCIFFVPILMLLVIAAVPICNWLQKLPISKTRTEWLLSSIFAGMTLLSSTTGAGGTVACLPWPKQARSESVDDHGHGVVRVGCTVACLHAFMCTYGWHYDWSIGDCKDIVD